MSAGRHRPGGRVIPLCRTCQNEATQIITYGDGEAFPYCPMCANMAFENAYARDETVREYPLEEYYFRTDERVSQFDPHDSPEFELYHPDHSETVWLTAYNSVTPGSSKDLSEWC